MEEELKEIETSKSYRRKRRESVTKKGEEDENAHCAVFAT